jgi:hypothetical protein
VPTAVKRWKRASPGTETVSDQYVTLTIVFFAETEMRKKLDREAFFDFVRAPALA